MCTFSVKAVDMIHIALPAVARRQSTTVVCTISSDGKVRLYDLSALPASSSLEEGKTMPQLEPVAEYDTKGTRLTCLTLADGDADATAPANGKRKRAEDEDEEDADDFEDEDDAAFDSQQEDEIEGEGEGSDGSDDE